MAPVEYHGLPVRDVATKRVSFVSAISAESKPLDDHPHLQQSLNLHRIKLSGRDKEVDKLLESYRRVSSTGNSEMIACHGESGVGKSKLIEESLRNHVIQQGGFYATGKFDQLLSHAPYSALMNAFSDLVDLINHNSDREQIKQAIKEQLGVEIRLMTKLIPSLSYLFEELLGTDTVDTENSQYALTRFQILCRTFLRAVSSGSHPVVFVLDDLQWADAASTEVLKSIMKFDLTHALVIIAYRDDSDQMKSNETKPLRSLLDHCETDSFQWPLHGLRIMPLEIQSITTMLSSLTGHQHDDVLPLGEVVLRKTFGNAYFCVQFLEMLESGGLVYMNSDSKRWEWDLATIEAQTNSTDNVASLTTEKVKRLDPRVQLVLTYAAFLGYHLYAPLLHQVLCSEANSAENKGDILDGLWKESRKAKVVPWGETVSLREAASLVDDALVVAQREHMIDDVTSMKLTFKFSHDKIQDSLLSSIREHEADLELINLHLGRIIRRLCEGDVMDPVDRDWMFFLSVNHFNNASNLLVTSERLEVIHLNVEAGNLAALKFDYALAKRYFQQSIDMLQADHWTSNYELALEVYQQSAEMELCNGNISQSQELVKQIMLHATSYKDTTRAYNICVEGLSAEGRYEETLDVGFEALRELGIKLPNPRKTTPLHLVAELIRVKIALRKKSVEDLSRLPPMENETILAAMHMISAVGLAAFLVPEAGKNCFVVLALRSLRLSLKYGLCGQSPQVFAAYGVVLLFLGDHDAAHEYAHLALQTLESSLVGVSVPRTVATTHSLILHWRKPLADLLPDQLRGHEVGMIQADTTHSIIVLAHYLENTILLGTMPFSEVEQKVVSFLQQAEEFQWGTVKEGQSKVLCQLVINMIGKNEVDPSRLIGDVADERELEAIGEFSQSPLLLQCLRFFCLFLAYHFENLLRMSELVGKVQKNDNTLEGHFSQKHMRFYVGMTHSLLYRRNKLRRHRVGLRKMVSIFKGWSDKGFANVQPYLSILQMEEAASLLVRANSGNQKRRETVNAACQTAISTAGNERHGMNWAITSERAADIMVMLLTEETVGARHVRMAIELYRQLEAWGKVDFLERRYQTELLAAAEAEEPV